MPTGQIKDEGNKRSIRNVTRLRKEGEKKLAGKIRNQKECADVVEL